MSHPSFPSPVCPQARHGAFGHCLPHPPQSGCSHASVLAQCGGAQGWGVHLGAEHWRVVLPETLKLEETEAPTVGVSPGLPSLGHSGGSLGEGRQKSACGLSLAREVQESPKAGGVGWVGVSVGVEGGQPRGLCLWHFPDPEYGLL